MNILETLQKIAATTERLDMALAEIERERAERQRFEDAATARMERLYCADKSLSPSFVVAAFRRR